MIFSTNIHKTSDQHRQSLFFSFTDEACEGCIATLANRIVFLCNGSEQAKSWKSDRECAAAISNFFTMKEEVAEEIKKANPNGRIKTMIDFVKSECDKETGNSCSHKQVKNSSN